MSHQDHQNRDNDRPRLSSQDPVNTTLPYGQQPASYNGANREVSDAHRTFGDQLQSLEGEKISLMKRLNMVLSELEKATHDKSDIAAKLRQQERLGDELKHKLEEVSGLKNVVNRNLQDDLKYEVDMSQKLRDELERFEREKEMLLKKLKEEENLSEQIARETNTINSNLMQRTDDLKKLEYEHSAASRRLHQLNDELEALRGQEVKTRQQKVLMDNQLHDLTQQRNDLIKRMNELSERYETYVSTMNRERSDICRQNKHKIKHLVAKLLVQILQENIQRKRKVAFLEISNTAKQMNNLERRLSKLQRILQNYVGDRKRHFIRLWYRRAFNCMEEIHKRNIMLEKNVKLKREQKYFYVWRKEFLKRNMNRFGRAEANRVLRQVMDKRQAHRARNAMCKWRDHVELCQARESFLTSVVNKKYDRSTRKAFVYWLCFVKRENLLKRYETLSEIVTTTWFKQRVFLGLKHACQQQKADETNLKFKSWKNWCQTARENKFFDKKSLLIDKIDGQRQERLLKRCFDQIRFDNMQWKFEAARDELNLKLPEKEELEYRRDCIIKNTSTRTKAHVLRQCYLRHCDTAYRAMMIWRNACNFHKHVMNRLKLRLINIHKQRERIFFMRWKDVVDKEAHRELLKETEDQLNDNQNLTNELVEKKDVRQAQKERAACQQIDKLERIRNMIVRKSLRRCYNKWVRGAEMLNGLERGVNITKKVELRHRARFGFRKWLSQAKAIKRQEFINKKCDWFANQRQNVTKKDVWFTWLRFIRQFKLAKKFLDRASRGIDLNTCGTAFMRWKQVVAKNTQKLFEDNINELKRRQDEHSKAIAKNKNDLANADNTKHHIIAQMKSLGQKVMANFIARTIHMQTARGFYIWVDETHSWNRKRRIVKNTIIYWTKKSEAQAFRTWAENHHKRIEGELKLDFCEKEDRRRTLVKQGKIEEQEQTEETDRLKASLKEKIAQRDSLLRSFQVSFETHFSRTQNNAYIGKKRNIFGTWREYVRSEKNAVNVIGAIARRTLRIEVFQRIRLAARERWLDKNASRICQNFFRMVTRNNMRLAISKWRSSCTKKAQVQLDQATKSLNNTIVKIQTHTEAIVQQKQVRAFNVIRLYKLRKYLTGFKEMTKFLKALRIKDTTFKQNLLYLRAKRVAQLWYQRSELTVMMRRRQAQTIKDYNIKQMKKAFQGLKIVNKATRTYSQRMRKLMSRMQQLDLARAFHKWQHWSLAEHEKDQQSKLFGSSNLFNIIERLTRRKLAVTLHDLRIRTNKKDFKENFLKRVILHASRYRLRYFMHKWAHKKNCIKLAQIVNTEGDVVLRKNEIQRNINALRRYLIKAGYSPEQIDTYVEKKILMQKGNMQRGIVGMFFKKSEFNVVPKAFNSWKHFVNQRKLARQAARLILNNFHHPLSGWFYRWKYDSADVQSKMKHLSKQQLIDKIIADENLIGATEQRVQRMDEAIDHLAIQRENLLGHYIRGQKLAVALCKNNYLKTCFRAFLRWKRYSQEYENLRLIEQLERTNQMITELSNHVGKLDHINRNLLSENEELRQAALDGIEIAKVVQELTREREALSHDLADRSGTIKKLIEDNNNLSVRLNIAQKEAQQLEMINHQLHHPQAEREFH